MVSPRSASNTACSMLSNHPLMSSAIHHCVPVPVSTTSKEGGVAAVVRAQPVAAGTEPGFVMRFEDEADSFLDQLSAPIGDAKWAFLSRWLRDVDTSDG